MLWILTFRKINFQIVKTWKNRNNVCFKYDTLYIISDKLKSGTQSISETRDLRPHFQGSERETRIFYNPIVLYTWGLTSYVLYSKCTDMPLDLFDMFVQYHSVFKSGLLARQLLNPIDWIFPKTSTV